MELEITWLICLISVMLAIVQLMIGYALGVLWERKRHQKEELTGTMRRRSRQLVHWVCGVLGESTQETTIPFDSMEGICDRLEKLEKLPAGEVTQLMIDVVNEVVRSNEHLRDQIATLRIQLQHQESEVQSQYSQAMTDSLTCLPNRRALDLALTRRFTEWKTQKTPLAVALIDIDRFKQLNDRHGHLAGDRVLSIVATTLRKSFRSTDVVARFGGEEFAVVLPHCGPAAAEAAIVAALLDIERATINFDGLPLSVTASAGLVISLDQSSVKEILRQADEALYASKEGGRNCAHVFAEGGCQLLGYSESSEPADRGLPELFPTERCELTGLSAVLRERLLEVNADSL